MLKHYRYILGLMAMVSLHWGCTGLRSLGEGEHLYQGCTVHIDSARLLQNPAAFKVEVKELVPVKPNLKVLWMRPLLSLHQTLPQPKKETGFWHFMKYKIGEPPALLENVKPANIVTAVENRLQNRGHFRVKALAETKVKARTGRLALSISPGQPYTIRTIVFPSGNQSIISDIRTLEPATLVKPKTIYNLQALEDERKRVDAALKEKGYFYFKPDYLLFSADTTVGNRYVDLALGLKADVPADASLAVRFRNIYVSDDYSFRDYMPDTTLINNVHFVSQHHQFRPSTILNAVRFQKDSLYSRTNHYNTLRNLMGIGVYRFVNAQFTLIDSMPGYLDVSVLLTPVKQKSLSLELNASVKTTNYIGPGVNVNFKNRNFLGGAELLSMTLGGTVETQFKGDGKGQTSYQTYLDASLSIPRLVPFQFSNRYLTTSIPKTIISVGGGIYSRVNLYELRSFSASLGYNWKPKGNMSHLFRPIETSYTDLAKTSQEFNDYLQENPSVQRSFEEQFIIGGNYEFSNSFYVDDSKKHLVSLNESADLSGNLTSLLTTLKYGSFPTADNQHLILGMPYSQYVKLRTEVRYNLQMNKHNQLAFRFIAGAGIPYGNSLTLPYVKQFYVGGSNSIRSFIARSIGPGSYRSPDSIDNLYIDQAGDIKLESNLEYRFGIYKFLRGALFVDAGNIWLVNDDPQRQGAKFGFDTFASEIAVGTGWGLRLDFNVIVVRCDWAFPLRKPNLPVDERWVVDGIDVFESKWRRDNVITNISIGYPF